MAKVFDIRDVTRRFEELENNEERNAGEEAEYQWLNAFFDEVRGCGAEYTEYWHGEWYPRYTSLPVT